MTYEDLKARFEATGDGMLIPALIRAARREDAPINWAEAIRRGLTGTPERDARIALARDLINAIKVLVAKGRGARAPWHSQDVDWGPDQKPSSPAHIEEWRALHASVESCIGREVEPGFAISYLKDFILEILDPEPCATITS